MKRHAPDVDTRPPTARELRARAHRLMSRAHKLLAQAEVVDDAPAAGQWLDLAQVAAAYPVTERAVRDACARGELVGSRAGGRSRGRVVVQRSEVERWLRSQPVTAKPRKERAGEHDAHGDDDAEYLRLVTGARR